jgi:hypothetical protein
MFSRYKNIDISNIKSIEFIDMAYLEEENKEEYTTTIYKNEIDKFYYNKKDKIYIIELDHSDNFIFNAKEVKITYESILK